MSKVIEQEVMELRRQFPYEVAEVFRFWVTPTLIEMWSAPEGMTLEVPKFEARKDGEYVYQHTDAEGGVWECQGHFKDFQRNVRLIMIDNVSDPKGKQVHRDLECIVDFRDLGEGQTEVQVRQRGFRTVEDLRDCRKGWTQCLEKLGPVMAVEGNHHRRRQSETELRV